MNAIIWWLESPWQLRTLVFIFSFFVCFVAPWLHSQSFVSTRITRKPLEEKSETVSPPKAEAPLQQAEEHAKVPASEDQGPAQVAALPAEATAPSKREQIPVPAQPKEGIAPAPAAQDQTPAPGEIAARPASEDAPVTREEAPSPEQTPVEPAPRPVMQEHAAAETAVPAEEEAPLHREEAPVSAQTPVTAGPPPSEQEQAPATARIATPPAEATAPIEREEASASASAPPYAAPAPERPAAPGLRDEGQVPAQTQKPVEKSRAPVESKSPAKQEQVTVQAPAPSEAPKAESTGRFSFVDMSGSGLTVAPGASVERQEFAASTASGGAANVEVYVLSNKALRRPNRPGGVSNGEVNAVLDSDAFASAAARFDTVACVGLGSRRAALSTKDVARLVDNGAVQLCGIIARKPYVSENTRLYGLPLGQLSSAPSARDHDKSLVIIGIKNAKGELADAAVQKRMISEIIRGGKIANFPLGANSDAASGKELHYIEVRATNGYKNRPLNVAPVKRSYAIQQKKQGLQNGPARNGRASAGRRPCAARAASSRGTKKAANPETARSKVHGCGIFDFPF